MKMNYVHQYSTTNLQPLFVYGVRPLLILSFLFCQLSFQTDVANHVHYEEISQKQDLIKPANIVIPGSSETPPGGTAPTEPIVQPGKKFVHPAAVKIKTVGKRSAQIYRIML